MKKLPTFKELNEAWYNEPRGREERNYREIPDEASDQAGKKLLDRFKKIASSYNLTPSREYKNAPMQSYTTRHPMLWGKSKETIDYNGQYSSYGVYYETPKKKFRIAAYITIDKMNTNQPVVGIALQKKFEDENYFDDEHPLLSMYYAGNDKNYSGERSTLDQIFAKFNELCPQIAKGIIKETRS